MRRGGHNFREKKHSSLVTASKLNGELVCGEKTREEMESYLSCTRARDKKFAVLATCYSRSSAAN